jgi:hypothetical protein
MRREPLHGDSGLHTPADRASPFEHTRAPCARSDLGSCSSADDGLARPSQAADAAERSERACRCYRRTGSSTLDGRGHQGVGCSRVAAIDVVRQLWPLASKLVWWPPWHGVWPVTCSQGHIMYGLGPKEVNRLVLSVCRRAGAGQEPRAGPRKFGRKTRGRARRLLVATCAPAYDPN